MKRIATTLSSTAALAAASVVFLAGPALADPPQCCGTIEQAPPQGDPEPSDPQGTVAPAPADDPKDDVKDAPHEDPGDPAPEPTKGPGDIAQPEPEPTHGPGDIANPEEEPTDGPDDLANPTQDPTVNPDGPDDLENPQHGCQVTHGCTDDGSTGGSGEGDGSTGGTGEGDGSGGSGGTTHGQSVSGGLPFTGVNSLALGGIGTSLLVAGAGALLAARRRTAAE